MKNSFNSKYKVFDMNESINTRIEYLRKMKADMERKLAKMPGGNLLVAPGKTKETFRYYLRKSPHEKMGEYLKKKDEKLKSELAEKKYIQTTVKKISSEISKLEKIQSMKLSDSIIDAYSRQSQGVKQLIDPIAVDDETFVNMWMNIPYSGLEFSPDDKTEYYSKKNERMRSKSEVLIANHLFEKGIPYKYECPIVRANGELLYPDFTVLDVKKRRIVYWEHLGRMGDMSYVSKNVWKLDEYKKVDIILGINLFITFESNLMPMGTREPLLIIGEIIG